MTKTNERPSKPGFSISAGLAFLVFMSIAVFFLWAEHKAHIMGALPYVLALLCVAVHFFMHGGHGDHGGGRS